MQGKLTYFFKICKKYELSSLLEIIIINEKDIFSILFYRDKYI